MNLTTCSIFFHNYYGDHDKWVSFFSKISVSFNLYYNVVKESIYNISISAAEFEDLFNSSNIPMLNNAEIRFSSNKGKDIGGKMLLLDAYLQQENKTGFLLFLHDKKSSYSTRGDAWRDKLFRIGEPTVLLKAIETLNSNSSIGIIAAKEFITCEYDTVNKQFSSVNKSIIKDLIAEYQIKEKSYNYIAGSMFLCRSEPIANFFLQNGPLVIRASLENGNVLDDEEATFTHSWERILPWLITAEGYLIKGV